MKQFDNLNKTDLLVLATALISALNWIRTDRGARLTPEQAKQITSLDDRLGTLLKAQLRYDPEFPRNEEATKRVIALLEAAVTDAEARNAN